MIPTFNKSSILPPTKLSPWQSAQIVRGQLTEDSTNSIAWYICLNSDMTFRVKVVEDWSFDERLS